MDSGNPISNDGIYFFACFFIHPVTDFVEGWLNIIMNWSSLLFASAANFVIPFLLYFASRRRREISVLDEVEG